MKNVLVFFNSQPVMVQKVKAGEETIIREYPNGEVAHLKIQYAGIHSITGDHSEFCVASDRELTSHEIVDAANKILK
ncbi:MULTISPECIES: hypothetical protein [Kosakonia]|uniref:Phage protein n=1 Tax=Kosakonia sacchari TaxID=1158459 RepID=A0ABZ0MJP6_9ENTR|nr:hypothetical protein [Kosakonia sacchari]WOZ75686.1 hypothetical protein Q8Y70_13775 [Kosakonia sacchari]